MICSYSELKTIKCILNKNGYPEYGTSFNMEKNANFVLNLKILKTKLVMKNGLFILENLESIMIC